MVGWLVMKLRRRGWTSDHELLDDDSFSTDVEQYKVNSSSNNFGKPQHNNSKSN